MTYCQIMDLGIRDWLIFYNKKEWAICCSDDDTIKIWIFISCVTRRYAEDKLWGYWDETCFSVHMKVLDYNQRCRIIIVMNCNSEL
jgi:hypothetical protein